ncbi:M20 family metallopeptidase [Brachyspira hyodysenteriae]|uniref:M20 metallopeptidase family protein n=1 Tax=Brachyspira hyodysenteriae TaxID=159 RepID=UPI0022CD98F5|nr:M20 family metallopeptidase [Brachyspira hyodysenteriae]MCZ9839115.1 M20 family metallopeptidase [Brachyspira hyodysenteriae]MCZ9847733.1 M20 family metallopeptidase [Brachyspira hyodysenteriae]MCZ9851302.1 M20 family metallopeptidase [Brachyspira hyodysenteriae]MCZ9859972.1 M20 family metallopeptidase [Brachyspira hyodysenteriae]MCZ9870481.1 M20 family metallopeptidase [Brachyspira hyodysenteriae]
MQDNIVSENVLSSMKDFLIDLRRDLHAHPELGFQEFRTSEKISSILDSLNIKYRNKVAETGIIADIEGEDKDFTIAFRADIDALPMEDKKNCSYSSKNKGKCHSCGHDVHTAILTGVAKYFSEIKPPCNIRLIYQPAEETTGGALPMINEHALDNVNVIYGLHVRPEINVGQVSITYGAMYASSNMFEVHIQGKSAHGAKSYNGIDPIVIAANIITQLHSFTSAFTDGSMRLHIGTINGGSANNVVADNVKMEGIIRMLCDDDTRNKRLNMIENIINNTAKSFNADAKFINIPSYPALINHDDAVNIVKNSGEYFLGKENCLLEKANMTAEDFSYYLQRVKGAFFSLGVSNEKINAPIHNGLFDIDENAINIGVGMQVLNVYNTYKNKDRFIK